MPASDGRPDPDLLLRQVQAEERRAARGRLKVFLGYASGVGKTFTMLDEARRRRERGEDVVVAAIQPRRPPETEALLASLEIIPALDVNGLPGIDVGAVLRRRPRLCVIDGLAYDNPPGSRNSHRWQDVRDLLGAGISVVTSINLQYIAEYREQVETITGKHVDQTVPLAFIHGADEIEIVDAPASDALRQTNGDIEPRASLAGREDQLRALRELTLVAAADAVDRQLEAYLERNGVASQWGAQERILVCITARSDATQMIASGRRNADRFHGELYVAYVEQPDLVEPDRLALERNLGLARENGAHVVLLQGIDAIDAILSFAAEHGITQIFVGHSLRHGWRNRLAGSPVDRLIRRAEGIDVQVFPH